MKRNPIDPEVWRKLYNYDPDTGDLTALVRRNSRVKVGDVLSNAFTNDSGKKYLRTMLFGKNFQAHRIVWAIHHGEDPGDFDIDHKDGNGLNNRISNLRLTKENMKNKKLQKNNTSGSAGVTWHKAAGKWKAQLRINGKQTHLGYFVEKSDAIAAVEKARIEPSFHSNHGQDRPL